MNIFNLLISFQIKQFLCDYPLQSAWMLTKFKRTGWFLPLLSHAAVHAMGTALIISYVNVDYLWLALIDLVAHFTIDRIKARYGSSDMTKTSFWFGLGADQALHHLTHYSIIYILMTR